MANPYVGATSYLNPDYVNEVKAQASQDGFPAEAAVANNQTAIWMDHIGAITGDGGKLGLQAQMDNALSQAANGPETIEVVVYDCPAATAPRWPPTARSRQPKRV